MSNRNPEFWQIVETEFPEHRHDRFLDEQIRERARQKLEIEDRAMQWERYTAASYDDRIADYFLYGLGDEESLIAQLQRDYELSEQEVVEAIDKAIGQLQDVTDYGDEA